MRVNVYAEEVTSRIEVVTKEVVERCDVCSPEGLQCPDCHIYTFHGVRFWLKFPNQPWWEHRPGDDDSSALTIWADDSERLVELIEEVLRRVRDHHYG